MKASLSHYHIACPNKFELAEWYKSHLGFEIVQDVEALGERDGPLIVSGDGGRTGISIFTSKDLKRDFALKCIPAFEVSTKDFIDFYKAEKARRPETAIYDHLSSFSVYFFDPMGTKLEFTAANYQETKDALAKEQILPKVMNPSHDPDYQKR